MALALLASAPTRKADVLLVAIPLGPPLALLVLLLALRWIVRGFHARPSRND
jgi:hypothetical protein